MNLKTALIIEDDDLVTKTYRTFLEGDYDVFTAKNLKEGRNYYNKKFDLIILDGLEGDCFELYDKLEGEFKIICTGNEDVVKRAIEEKKKVFKKPFYMGDILKEIK